MKLRLSEQYIDALSEILNKSTVVMVPEEKHGSSSNPMSAQNVAQIITMYKNIMGDQKSSTNMGNVLGAGSDEVLKRIVQDLDDLKTQQAGSLEKKRDENYKYLDDKSLYSTDS